MLFFVLPGALPQAAFGRPVGATDGAEKRGAALIIPGMLAVLAGGSPNRSAGKQPAPRGILAVLAGSSPNGAIQSSPGQRPGSPKEMIVEP